MEISGIIERTSDKNDRFGIKLVGDERWFNGFGKISVSNGDKVLITYEENKSGDRTYYNTKPEHVVKTGESMNKKAGIKNTDDLGAFVSADKLINDRDINSIIIRQTATKCASWIVAGLFQTDNVYTFEKTVELIKKYTDAIEKNVILEIEDEV